MLLERLGLRLIITYLSMTEGMNILINQSGEILAGEEVGKYVRVLDDLAATGGYLILTAASVDMTEGCFDNWVESIEEVGRFFEESKWVVRWIG